MSLPDASDLPTVLRPSKREIAGALGFTLLRLLGGAVIIFGMLNLVPDSPDQRVVAPVLVALLAVALYVWFFRRQLRGISAAKFPTLRAGEAMILVAGMFLAVFAMIYVIISEGNRAAFSEDLDAFTSYYFSLTVLATVGFGDITPVNTLARSVTMVQMALDLVFVAVVIRVIGGATKRALVHRSATSAPPADPTGDSSG